MMILVLLLTPILFHSLSDPAGACDGFVILKDSSATFTGTIAPLLKANCTPCHFPGGSVYEKYPFESYQTAYKLRTRLGTRLKEPEQQKILNDWLQGGAKE